MRINLLRLSNINSLKDNQIDLDFSSNSKIGQEGLFIITGATGSGKTSIFDAVCVALYGRTPRLGAGSEITDLMTRHSNHCFAEVEFEVKDRHYKSHWSLKKTKTGNFKTADMELSIKNNGQYDIIETGLKKVIPEIENITGLDFQRFTKSILLAQGDFATFIKSTGDERAVLLEKITGTEIYSEISKRVYDKSKEEKKKRDEIFSKIESLELTDPDLLENKKLEKAEIDKKLNDLEFEKTKIVQLEKDFADYTEIKTSIEGYNSEIITIEEEKKENISNFDKLEKYLKIRELESSYYFILDKEKELEKHKLNASDAEKMVESLKISCEKANIGFNHSNEEFDQFTVYYNEYKEKLIKAEGLDNRIEEKNKEISNLNIELKGINSKSEGLNSNKEKLNSEYENLESQQKQLTVELDEKANYKDLKSILPILNDFDGQRKDSHLAKKSKINEKKDIQLNIDQFKKEKANLEKTFESQNLSLTESKNEIDNINIEISELKNGKEIDELEVNIEQLKSKIKNLESFIEVKNNYNNTKAENNKLDTVIQDLAEKVDSIKAELKDNKHHFEMNALEKDQLEIEKIKQIKQKNYDRERKELEKDKPCPLCGSTIHPVNNLEFKNINELENKISDITVKINDLDKKIKLSERSLAQTEQEEKHKVDEKDKINLELNRLKDQYDRLLAEFEAVDVNSIEEYLNQNNVEHNDLEKKYKKILNLEKSLNSKKDQAFNLEKQLNDIRLNLEKNSSKINEENNKLLELDKQIEGFDKTYNDFVKKISEYLKSYETDCIEAENLTNALANLNQSYKNYLNKEKLHDSNVTKLSEINNQITSAQNDIQQAEFQHSEKLNLIQSTESEKSRIYTERTGLVKDLDVQLEKVKLEKDYAKKQNDLKLLKEEYNNKTIELEKANESLRNVNQQINDSQIIMNTKENEFNNKLAQKAIYNKEEFSELLLKQDEIEYIENLKKKLDEKLLKSKSRLEDSKLKLNDLINKNKEIESCKIEVILENKTNLDMEIEKVRKDNLELEIEIREVNKKIIDEKDLKVHLENHEKDYKVWSALNDLIGSANGSRFRDIAQGMTLKFLIQKANNIIKSISDRYSLTVDENKALHFNVIDHYQADTIRRINTLSGGESFLVSLSLALSLSQLVSKKTQVDSLFIDEGFGTLDSETLDIVLNALSKLKSQGKLIGIISHIEILKERITAQIQVQLISGGHSKYRVA